MWLGLLSRALFPAADRHRGHVCPTLIAGGVLWKEALVTLARLGAAFLLAAGPAVALGLAMGLWRPVRSAVEPYVVAALSLAQDRAPAAAPHRARRGRDGLRRDRRHHRVLPDRAQHGGRRAEPRPAPDRGGTQLRRAGRGPLPQDHPAGRLARHLHGAAARARARPHHRHRRRVRHRQERARSSRVPLVADAAHRGDVRRLRPHRTDRSRAHPGLRLLQQRALAWTPPERELT